MVVPTGALGVIHRRIGIAQQRSGVLPVGREKTDANARGGVKRIAIDQITIGQVLLNLVGNAGRHHRAIDFRKHDDKFVTAQASHQIAGANGFTQAQSHFFQDLIANMVAEGVVDVLEVVEVNHHQCQAATFALANAQTLCQLRLERKAVRQLGERVVVSQVGEAISRLFAGADVVEVGHIVLRHAGFVADNRDRQPLGIGAAVLALVPDFALPEAFLGQRLPHRTKKRRVGVAGGENFWIFTQNFVNAVTSHFGKSRIDCDNPVAGIGNQNRFPALHKGTQQH